ncbi:carboxy methyl transferase for protein phosphatase 2A, partial [Oleoguttula sp. CCFEE 5521]
MADIPNLNTLRSGRGGLRGRGFRRGGRAIPENDDSSTLPLESEAQARDRLIQQTDNDASASRLSAIELGYLNDDYAKEFAQPGVPVTRRYPIINRGTYVRSQAIDHLVGLALNDEAQACGQVISLGAGSDTRYFRMSQNYRVQYHELDFEANVATKRGAFERSSELSLHKKMYTKTGTAHYLHAIDLRELASDDAPTLPDIDWTLPTLILSECCLCYLAPDTASAVINYFTSRLKGAVGLVLYEPIRPNDAFGKTMVSNLGSRGIHMQTLQRYHSLETQRQRMKLAGLGEGQGARDIYQIWESEAWIPKAERERVEALEWLDEIEEWKLLASHYCVAWGWKGDVFSRAWEGLKA